MDPSAHFDMVFAWATAFRARVAGYDGAMPDFRVSSAYRPTGDQPRAIESLALGFGFELPASLLPADGGANVCIFAVSGERAAELRYAPRYPWPH